MTATEAADDHPAICALADIPPRFFIPRLDDKPQNPIMDTLRLSNNDSNAQPTTLKSISLLPPGFRSLSEDLGLTVEQEQLESRGERLWQLAAARLSGNMNQVLSWDALRPSHNASASPSPFLSEQPSEVFASARYHLRPPLHDPDVRLVYVLLPELCQSLLLTVSGMSSHLHIWDHDQQKFVLKNLEGRLDGRIVIVGKDEVVSASLMKRFITIGTLTRRLELLTERQESRYHPSSRAIPTLHAFTHALSSILAHLCETAETIPSELQAITGDARLTALWARYEDTEHVLVALAALCGREEVKDPLMYDTLPVTPTSFLSLIYNQLADHIERSSPRVVIATLALMLTTASRGYMQNLCASVGYNTVSSRSESLVTKGRAPMNDRPRLYADPLEDEQKGRANDDDEIRDSESEAFPEFITAELAEVLSRARKSLVLLRAADPGHPLLIVTHLHPEIEWLWTEEQLENLEDELSHVVNSPHRESPVDELPAAPTVDVMQAFKIFDLTPGELGTSIGAVASTSAGLLPGAKPTSALRAFLSSFPSALPPSTPILARLTVRVLSPLITHAQALSGALVARFLTPDTHLHLHTHLVLLRGYMLLTTHAFKARLQDALFSDGEDVSVPVVGSRTYAASEARENARERTRSKSGRSRSRSRAASRVGDDEQTKAKARKGKRAVGLSPALIIGDKWPPLGSDLNFLLRTVIVDTLEEGRFIHIDNDDDTVEDESRRAYRRIAEEAEWRLGFAIRDLPMGTGREKWLNPSGELALDFLYMHYQPPHPLDVLITPTILSKYHRMFAFNLRLLRVENVVRTLFRLTRKNTTPLFPTLVSSNKLMLHFRFVTQTFVMALSSYVYDVAIGSNMDAFLARLTATSVSSSNSTLSSSTSTSTNADPQRAAREELAAFADVFSLADYHSRVLDDVLSSCLLRSGQKAVGDILRGCMELVLELGVLAGEIRDRNLEEYEAAPMLEELWAKFRTKMATFVKVLKALVEKEADASGLVLSDIPLHMMQGHKRVSGTTANLHQLLLRLNMSDWWTRRNKPSVST
ncbi:Spc98 family-domain-containing protein [Daedaleopsis nitida]|nr:Spc98 family-domain-containing protein [Daedaleopsis nitida]